MGQNNDAAERGEPQGQQGGNLAKDPDTHTRMRQKEAGYARPPADTPPHRKPERDKEG
jgi:hypothetical protein